MSALLFVILALFTADDPAAAADAPTQTAPAVAEGTEGPAFPIGAPHDDYGLVSWCYGSLRGYLDLHDEVMPEVTRIETTFRRPGSNLAEDLKVYDDMQRDGRKSLEQFERAIEAAEKASVRPIAAIGADAVARGRSTWAAAPEMPKARVAQEWMSWALPAVCVSTAETLEQRARLMGPAFQVNADPIQEPTPESVAETPAPANTELAAPETQPLSDAEQPAL
ncbi:hypothetical protein [Phenylobacterium sp.]|uniref:hypothetical protein n=1 Tax=Phenylobacterium sp. TaxID=1871053 RepID=UPI002732934F|nr:hypothetical protein [Phenylobacterium sp.]MDP3660169.1 hypothetical protein [Phenylobacterium sp.]